VIQDYKSTGGYLSGKLSKGRIESSIERLL